MYPGLEFKKTNINPEHPLRRFFRRAIDSGFMVNLIEKSYVACYLEEQILCGFIHIDNLYKIKDASNRSLDDVGDLLLEGDVLLKASGFSREFFVHKHIGDYTLFMLGMFPEALSRKRGKEFILGRLVIPEASLSEYYLLQGRRSYQVASEFTHSELFNELSSNFSVYRNVLEVARIYLESVRNREFLRAKWIITETD